jgi:hypothetical protein
MIFFIILKPKDHYCYTIEFINPRNLIYKVISFYLINHVSYRFLCSLYSYSHLMIAIKLMIVIKANAIIELSISLYL